ncbi:helix-turn-helix transcriptional regulator [Haloarchaeobius litoreus]|uniref:Helix-turn-helix transcriptional regulator n=1 Tax=Haloarchaeobius litoreus TaxID=755306 RepID=A0ABD6DL68_9EURY|nr:hypothetical protein [Haloarchaeobius litoreus]
MRSLSAFAVALLALSLVAAPVVGVASSGTAPAAEQSDRSTVQTSDSLPFEEASPHTVFEVNVTASGDARWSITYRYVLNSSNETEAFQRFGDDVSAGTADVGFSPQVFQRFAEQGESWTDREMTIEAAGWEDVQIRERMTQPGTATTTTAATNGTENETTTYIGELTYSFVWTGFASVEGNTIVVGDAFGTDNETWFNRLYDDQRFVLNSPTNYGIRDSPDDKGPDNGTLVWDGPVTFEPGYLETTYFELAPPNTTTPTDPNPEDEGLSPFVLVGLVGVLVVTAAGGAYMFAKRQSGAPPGAGPEPTPNGGRGPTSDGGATGAVPDEEEAAGAAEGVAAGAADEPPEADEIDEELLSDEERVLRLLDGNGGRMKQANIVKETGWSNAKVSQLLSGMADDEEIRKLRIGRENLITLPGESLGEFDDEP